MSHRLRRWLRGVAGVLAAASVIALLVAGCSRQEVAFCAGLDEVERVEVVNYYADHPVADLHTVDDPEEIDFACDYLWTYQQLPRRPFAPSELEQRTVTVLRLHAADGLVRTVWLHRLVVASGTTAIIFDSGASYYLPNDGPPRYYGPTTEAIDRADVPRR